MNPAQAPSVDTFRLLVEQSPFGIYIVNSDFKLVQVSLGAQKVFEQVRPLLGRDFAEVLRLIWPEPFATEAIGRFRHTLATGEPYHSPRTVELRKDIPETEAYDWKVDRLVLPDGRFGAVCHFYDLSYRLAAESAVRVSEERLALGVQAAGLALAHVDYKTGSLLLTAEAARLYGLGDVAKSVPREAVHASFHPDDREEAMQHITRSLESNGSGSLALDHRVLLPNGAVRWLRVRKQVAFEGTGEDRRPVTATLAALDITAEREASEAVRQSEARLAAAQRMETAGRIAGGVAHEANNQMTIVLGAVSFLLEESGLQGEHREDLEHIKRAAERTATICQQLLAFSRRQVLNRVELVPDEVTKALATLIGRSLGDRSRFEFNLDASNVVVRTDRSQLEQALLNLALNARDAMPNGGTLAFGSSAVSLSPGEVRHLGAALDPGRYWQLTVRDTGTGMDAATRARVFEPFFTTKPVGQGTGLGLSMVQGVLRQSGGDVVVESTPGVGTTFRLFLPIVSERAASPEAGSTTALGPGAGEVLLVDDEPTLLRFAERTLRAAGYTVRTAASGDLAMRLVDERASAPVCLVTDVMMPGLSGVDLAQRLRQRWPSVPVLLMSGHTERADEPLGDARTAFLPKPFTPAQLVRCVASLISGELSPRAASP